MKYNEDTINVRGVIPEETGNLQININIIAYNEDNI